MVGMALSSATLALSCLGGPSRSRTRRPGLQGAALATEAPLWVPPRTLLGLSIRARTAIVKGTSSLRRLSISAMEADQPARAVIHSVHARRAARPGRLLAWAAMPEARSLEPLLDAARKAAEVGGDVIRTAGSTGTA